MGLRAIWEGNLAPRLGVRTGQIAGAVVAVLASLIYALFIRWLGSVSVASEFTAAQIGLALAYGVLLVLWLGAEVGFVLSTSASRHDESTEPAYEEAHSEEACFKAEKTGHSSGGQDSEASMPLRTSTEVRLFGLERAHLPALRAAAEFVLIMGYTYVCDRTSIIPEGPKDVSAFKFWGLWSVILLVSLATLRPVHKGSTKPLQRDQTEEWKGWMQLMFILYHYFEQKNIYNAIRVYISCYVWMTGFGNFSYYYIKRDFTLVRFVQMMWRLNFFVFFVCATLNNEYMLYYICPMHTLFTWTVFFPLWIANQFNKSDVVCAVKVVVTLVITVILYDVPGVFKFVFYPFRFLVAFHDPLHPEYTDDLHEWFFRSGLDHLVWIFGMACALSFPYWDRQLSRLEGLPTRERLVYKTLVALVALGVGWMWFAEFFVLPKYEYNAKHPYTSWIPISCYMVLRNLSPLLRKYHMHLFAWCGKITLETYILQFHIWMKTTGINGSPKHLMVWIPNWFWTNMMLTSAAFIFLSYRVFKITITLRDACIPSAPVAIAKRSAVAGVTMVFFYGFGLALTR